MADKWTALHTFWNSFGLTAYDENTVPDDAQMPYITYEASVGSLEDQIPLVASLWYYTTSWEGISQKAEQISDLIGGGMGIPFDNGRLWVVRDLPFAQRMNEPGSNYTRRILMKIIAEFQ